MILPKLPELTTARPPSSSPPEDTRPFNGIVDLALSRMMVMMSSGVNWLFNPNIKAATPATCGAAIEVPSQLV